MGFFHRYIQLYLIVNYLPHLCHLLIIQKHIFFPISLLFTNAYSRKYAKTLVHIYMYTSRDATYRFRTSNNAKSNPEIKGCNSIFFRHDALQVSGHALFTSTPHVFLLNIFINKTERSIHFY